MLLVLFFSTLVPGSNREVSLTRDMIEDAAIRSDDYGLTIGRERAARLAAYAEASGDTHLARDAHYLIALSVAAQLYTGNNDVGTLRRLAAEGALHADRAAALDEHFAEGFALGSYIRGGGLMLGAMTPDVSTAMRDRFGKAMALDPATPPIALLNALRKSMDPAGPARPEGVQAFADLAKRLDAIRAAEGNRMRWWDVMAHFWLATVQLTAESPDAAALRGPIAGLVAMRPDSEQFRQLAARVEHRSWAKAVDGLEWHELGRDDAGDGVVAGAPDLRLFEMARGGERTWFRLTFEQPLPASFGVNVVVDRDGDPNGDLLWWGGKSRFRFDRLVTAWITREGDGYFGLIGITDADGARARNYAKLSGDVSLRIGSDGKSVVIGVPATVLDLMPGAKVIAAGGTHLVWSDNLTATGGEGIELPQ
jgi:hypothetical protein